MSNNKLNVLYVEDDLVLSYAVTHFLKKNCFEVTHCVDADSAWKQYMKNCYHICLFDILLSGKTDGFSLAKKIRSKNELVPILLISSESMHDKIIAGFDIGCDDYLTKPFEFEELLRRMNVFLKRTIKIESNIQSVFKIAELNFDHKNLTLRSNSVEFFLTQKEADILRYLCLNMGRIIKREELLMVIWGKMDEFLGRSMDVFMAKIRKYLRSQKNVSLQTIRGMGWRFDCTSLTKPEMTDISVRAPLEIEV